MFHSQFSIIFFILFSFFNSTAQDPEDGGFLSLFNGEDLKGWINVNCGPETWTVRDGMIICTGIPTGVLRTNRQYENFILELEWRHLVKGGNAGLFIHSDAITAPGQPFTRSIECQIMDGNEGDMFAIHGARLTPDNEDPFEKEGWMRSFPKEKRMNPTGEWNHYRIVSKDGVLTLAVNGKIVTRGFHLNPRKGYICLESEGSEIHFRNIRIKELPGSNPPLELTATEDMGYISLYNGLDLRGWHLKNTTSWKSDNWRLVCELGNTAQTLLTEKEYKNFKLIADWRLSAEPINNKVPVILNNGLQAIADNGEKILVPILDAGESSILLRGIEELAINITYWPVGSGSILDSDKNPIAIPLFSNDNPPGKWNRFEITVIGQKINIRLNGKTIMKDLQVDKIQDKGPIGIKYEGSPIQFANLYIKEL